MQPSVVTTLGDFLETLSRGGLVFVVGSNFSGRTSLLRAASGLEPADEVSGLDHQQLPGPGAFVGAEVYNSLSGLAVTVSQELRLQATSSQGELAAAGILTELGFGRIMDSNPFRLSGGEQAVLAVLSAALRRPRVLSLDCCLEQVDVQSRRRLLECLPGLLPERATVLMADNRRVEYGPLDGAVAASASELVATRRRAPAIRLQGFQAVPPARPCALELDGVSFAYRGSGPILRKCSLSLEPGFAYLLDGPNGSGKSTLAKILCGALKPDEGRIIIDGRPIRPWLNPAQTVAYHFQNPDVQLFCTTVEQEIMIGMPDERLSRGGRGAFLDALLNIFGLNGLAGAHPLDLPFVLRKRVALAATLAMGRPWIILDEPTLGQDEASADGIIRLVAALCSRGYGVIVISHCVALRSALQRRLRIQGGSIVLSAAV